MQSADQVEPLYAMILLDGSWAVIGQAGGFATGEQIRSTSDINEATVMQRYSWNKWLKHGQIVPAKVERKVTIIPG